MCKQITDTVTTKGGKQLWFWGKEQAKAFAEVKGRFISAPICAHFNQDWKTVVQKMPATSPYVVCYPNTRESSYTCLHCTCES